MNKGLRLLEPQAHCFPCDHKLEDAMHHSSPEMRDCIESCLRCYAVCLGSAMRHCLEAGGGHVEIVGDGYTFGVVQQGDDQEGGHALPVTDV